MSRDRHSPRQRPFKPGCGLARALSKLGFCSRSDAHQLIREGRVSVNAAIRRDPEWRVDLTRDRLEVDRCQVKRTANLYLMLNKPRGLVTTASDEKGRATVFECLGAAALPFVAPVGRLDKASEGLLLFTNDTKWAAHITAPAAHLEKTYHVQIRGLATDAIARRIQMGTSANGDFLDAKRVAVLRHGTRTSWLEVVLDEGKNRHIRRLLSALGIQVLRLVRISIGGLALADLPKGQFRHLTKSEVLQLGNPHPET